MLYRMLTNPAYGGAYAYGKTEQAMRYDDGEPRKHDRRKPREQWLALIPQAHEGYVSWEQLRAHPQIDLRQNLPRRPARCRPSEGGMALAAGLLRCRRCGHKLTVHYTGSRHDVLRYVCCRGWLDNGRAALHRLRRHAGRRGHRREMLRVVQPRRSRRR